MRIVSLSVLCCLFICTLSAQVHKCGVSFLEKSLETQYPGIQELINKTYENALANASITREVYEIPVVIHVLYNTSNQNLSDDIILSQMDVLNEDFRRLNPDKDQTREIFEPVAADAEIEFVLANVDPDGNPTTGITRTETDKESFVELDFASLLAALLECGVDITNPELTDEQLECILESLGGFDLDVMKSSATGGIEPWDTERYLNIWVCNLAVNLTGEDLPFLLGFAYPPLGAPNWPPGTLPEDIAAKDGVVVHYQAFGRNNPFSGPLAGLSDLGRTTTHEVGHYLGLRHIWGDGDCTMDDGLEDTPSAGSNSQPQTADIPSCESLHEKDSCLEDMMPDMIENYMDYSVESCQNMFSVQQVGLMRAMLEGPRSGLLDNAMSDVNDQIFSKFNISPNPFTASLNISLEENAVMEMMNVHGNTVLVESLYAGENKIFKPSLSPGVYLIKLTNDQGLTSISKVIKQ